MGEATRREFLLAAAASAAASLLSPACAARVSAPAGAAPPEARSSLARGEAWLWAQQAADGSFPSATYGLLRGGQSLTPFTLLGLLRARPAAGADLGSRRAVTAMLRMVSEDGALGLSLPVADYPSYATGMMLSCLALVQPEGWRERASTSVAWLRSQQLREVDGWGGHPAQGGWGMGGRRRRSPPNAGHVDLSMTRRVVEGLRAVGVAPDDPVLLEARDFASRCQARDGGFIYSPVELALNKGRRDAGGAPSGYGSATTDGLLCLAALGLGQGDAAERARQWLARRHRVDRNPGLSGGPMEAFAEAMRGYYRAGASECFARWGGPEGWREELAVSIVAEQWDDGSWRNPNALQKEDDPIVATGFALRALAALFDA